MKFEWDEKKNQTNAEKHGIDFNDAEDIFQTVRLTTVDNRKDYELIERAKTE